MTGEIDVRPVPVPQPSPRASGARVVFFQPDAARAAKVSQRLARNGVSVTVADDIDGGLACLRSEGADLALVSLRPDGLGILDALARHCPGLPAVMVVAPDELDLAALSLKRGAEDYAVVGDDDCALDLLEAVIDRSVNRCRLARERERATDALTVSEQRFRSLMEMSGAGIVLIGQMGTIRFANAAFAEMLGYRVAEIAGTSYFSLIHPDEVEEFEGQYAKLRTGEIPGYSAERRYRHRDGSGVWGTVNVGWLPNEATANSSAIAVVQDITALRRAEAALTKERNFIDAVLDSEAALLVVLDRRGCVVRWNRACSDLTGYAFEEVQGKPVFEFLFPETESGTVRRWFEDLDAASVPAQHEAIIVQKDRIVRIVAWSNSLLRNPAGEIEYLVASGIDITERKRAEAVIRHQANYDALTGLPNRTLFIDRLSQAIAASKRTGGLVAVLFIDLDRFKWVNDALGHRAGDQLLAEAARRLETSLRSSDTVARLGGDEFTVVIPNLAEPGDVETVARKILRDLSIPYTLDGREEVISCSIGITLYPNDADTVEGLLRNADIAMYRAKDAGRNGFVLFQPEMNAQAIRRKEMERQLRQTLEESGFVLHYQPIMSTATRRIVGVEALVRWPHPTYGMIPPDVFIPIAEETGLIVGLGEWVLRTACRQTRLWDDEGLPGLGVAVNVSAMQFQQSDYPQLVQKVLEDTDLAPDRLTIEITESLMLDDEHHANYRLEELRRIGVHLSVDDFGTGYSSLSYLKRLPIDGLKIDRSFIMDITTDADDAVVVDAIIALARSFAIRVVAEGVETEEQLSFLQSRNCAYAQGYLFSRPLPPEDLVALAGAASLSGRGELAEAAQ
ncbi:MAG: EAL domain-containing protein [Rhodospirillaceae bacterium]|nr:EAL domain-containing protein [Rhodospirillaceae bacterium]